MGVPTLAILEGCFDCLSYGHVFAILLLPLLQDTYKAFGQDRELIVKLFPVFSVRHMVRKIGEVKSKLKKRVDPQTRPGHRKGYTKRCHFMG